MRRDPPDRTAAAATVLILVALATLTFVVHNASPSVTSSDSVRFVPVAESLVARGSLDVSWSRSLPNGGEANTAMYQAPGDPGPLYPYYPLGPVLVACRWSPPVG